MKVENVQVDLSMINKMHYRWEESMTIYYVIDGTIKLRVWARDNIMKPGDFVIINQYEVYTIEKVSESNLVVSIKLPQPIITEVIDKAKERVIVCNSTKYREIAQVKYRVFEEHLKALILLSSDQYSSGRKDAFAKDFIEYIYEEFDYLAVGFGNTRFSDYIVDRNRFLYRKVFFHDGELSDKTLKEVADYLGVSYTYLRTDILERFGHGFSWFRYTYMTERAARLVMTTDRRLIDISIQCGFSDQKYFRKYFKLFFEQTPSKFRAIHKDQQKVDDIIIFNMDILLTFITMDIIKK